MTNSNKTLITKLGLAPVMRTAILRAPQGYLNSLELAETPLTRLSGLCDWIQFFSTSTEQLETVLPNLKRHLKSDGSLWLCWIKKSSSLHTGLSENDVRRLGLSVGLVDVKVAAITDDWSGLKFVYRLTDR